MMRASSLLRVLFVAFLCACSNGVSGFDTPGDDSTNDGTGADDGSDSDDGGDGDTDPPDFPDEDDGTAFFGPANTAGIINPYYTIPTWRLWVENQAPVHYSGYNMGDPVMKEADFAPPAEATRKFVDETVNTYPAPFVALTTEGDGVSGSWDDAYATRDGAHSNMSYQSWSDDYGNSIALQNQYIAVTFGTAGPLAIQQLGINFTSESLSNSGHQLISNRFQLDYTERNFSFVNTVRATPGYMSYTEQLEDRPVDSYDALFSHAFNSVGRSSSEVRALYKMLVAGSYMPRATKNLLKKHGAYGLALLSVFRQTLPYAEADGTPVGLTSEMLQRPAYLANGGLPSEEFTPRNRVYHQYDDPQHFYRMIQATRAMTVAPPFAVVRLVGLSVEKDGATIVDNSNNDARIKGGHKTALRFWGNEGETLTARIDIGDSYDLQELEMRPLLRTVYPEQKNVTITHEGGTVWSIRVAHDPSLPKGRIPVALFVNNGTLTSGPAFINFYWPEAGQVETPGYVYPVRPDSKTEVTLNKRPLFSTSIGADYVNVAPGATASFNLSCTDPEGFSTRYYRWSGEAGALDGNRFSFTPPAADPGLVYPVHLVCADGTGAYGSMLVRVAVTPNDTALPGSWKSTVYGLPEAAGEVHHSGNQFEIVGNGVYQNNFDHGRMIFDTHPADTELTARVVSLVVDGSTANSNARAGVMIRNHLGDTASYVFAYAQGNQGSATPLQAGGHVRVGELSGSSGKQGSTLVATQPQYVKVVSRGGIQGALASTNGTDWEQIWGSETTFAESVPAGFVVTNTDGQRGDAIGYARAKFELVSTPAVPVPIMKITGTLASNNTLNFKTKATLTLVAANAAHTIRYTTNGSEPTASSTLYSAPFDVTTQGDVLVKARAFNGGASSGVTTMAIKIVP